MAGSGRASGDDSPRRGSTATAAAASSWSPTQVIRHLAVATERPVEVARLRCLGEGRDQQGNDKSKRDSQPTGGDAGSELAARGRAHLRSPAAVADKAAEHEEAVCAGLHDPVPGVDRRRAGVGAPARSHLAIARERVVEAAVAPAASSYPAAMICPRESIATEPAPAGSLNAVVVLPLPENDTSRLPLRV